jgi:PIN domain nuclease of toxin-antitoxin system
VPRKTKVLYKYKRDIKNLDAMGAWYRTSRIHRKTDGSFENEIDQPIRDLMDKFEGKDRTEFKADAPYTFLDYRGWAQFPGHDSELPVRAIMHYQTKTIVALLLRQHDDPIDRMRFDKQSSEFEAFVGQFKQFLEIQQKEQQLLTQLQQPGVDPKESLAVAQAVEKQTPPGPIPPQWMKFDEAGAPVPPDPCKQLPIEMMSHASCIENPDGSMGLGIGTLLMPFQEATNILLTQFVQAATMK